MECLQPLSDFFIAINADSRISVSHIAVYAALLQYWKEQNYSNPIRVNKFEIMQIAKISFGTYYKVIKELSEYGYIRYEPSYKRNQTSKVYLTSLITARKNLKLIK